MSTTTFTDKLGDKIEIDDDEGLTGIGLLVEDRTQSSGSKKSTACLSAETAEAVAAALLKAAGKSVVDISTLKPARDLSFNEGMFRLAAIHKRTVEFRYAKAKGDYIEARRLNPTSVAEDGSYVDGEDPDREAPRRYRLDRVKGEVRFA